MPTLNICFLRSAQFFVHKNVVFLWSYFTNFNFGDIFKVFLTKLEDTKKVKCG